MKRTFCFLVLTAFLMSASSPVRPREKTDEFYKAIVYYLIKDLDQTKNYLDIYFRFNRQPAIKVGYTLLLANENWEATKKFNEYLETDYRSLEALIGISLATADMENSTSIENLNKALRLNPAYAPAYLCLGFEYAKRQNNLLAEQNYLKSIRFSKIPDSKILLRSVSSQWRSTENLRNNQRRGGLPPRQLLLRFPDRPCLLPAEQDE